MSVSKPENKTEFIDYCLRKLGAPVIRINVDAAQVEDAVQEALQYFQLNHYNGSAQVFLPLEVTQDVIDKGYFEVADNIIGITKILDGGWYGSNQFTIDWQLMAATMPYALSGGGLTNFYTAMMYRETMKDVMGKKTKNMRFNMMMGKLFLAVPKQELKVGQVYVVEAWMAVDPDENTLVWNEHFLKEYAVALIKKQWGNNLRKLQNVQLVGGVTIDGQQILMEAVEALQALEEETLSQQQEPVDMYMA